MASLTKQRKKEQTEKVGEGGEEDRKNKFRTKIKGWEFQFDSSHLQ